MACAAPRRLRLHKELSPKSLTRFSSSRLQFVRKTFAVLSSVTSNSPTTLVLVPIYCRCRVHPRSVSTHPVHSAHLLQLRPLTRRAPTRSPASLFPKASLSESNMSDQTLASTAPVSAEATEHNTGAMEVDQTVSTSEAKPTADDGEGAATTNSKFSCSAKKLGRLLMAYRRAGER